MPASRPLVIFQLVYKEEVAPLSVDRAAATTMQESARNAWPQEACGALLGVLHAQGGPHVQEAAPVPNGASAAARQYFIPAEEVRRLDRHARMRGLDVVGFYHSHPTGGTLPSPTDLECAWPGYVYAIVDGTSLVIQYWMLAEDRSTFRPLCVHA